MKLIILSLLLLAYCSAEVSAQNDDGLMIMRNKQVLKMLANHEQVDTTTTTSTNPPQIDTDDDEHTVPDDLIAHQFSHDSYEGEDITDLIMRGTFNLVNVDMNTDPAKVMGYFCAYDFRAQETSPSQVPTFIDLVSLSDHCPEHVVKMPLGDMADAAKAHDDMNSDITPLEVGGFIFHLPKSGSSLLSNSVAASGHRVISESNVLARILNCNDCSEEVIADALEDAVYLLSRDKTVPPSAAEGQGTMTKKLYIKLISANRLPLIRQNFPDAKEVFVYRDPNVVVQKLMNCRPCKRACAVKQRRNPAVSLQHYLSDHDIQDTMELDDASMCAAGVAMTMLTILDADADLVDGTNVVSYDRLLTPAGMKEALEKLGVQVEDEDNHSRSLKEIVRTRSNVVKEEVFDVEKDTVEVSDAVKAANERFLLSDLRVRRFRL